MFVPEFIFNYEISNPNYYVVAAEHTFDCNCMDCVAFLFATGYLEFDTEDQTYIDLQSSYVDNELSSAQISLLRELFNTYL